MPKVSIIIPTYNSGETVRNALESVYRQSFQDWECIVVDGASKDNTISIVKEYSEKDARFRYISEKDNGIYDAFNKGWRIAKGEWVYYLGSDDSLKEEGLNVLTHYCSNNVDVVYGKLEIKKVDGSSKIIEFNELSIKKVLIPSHQSLITRRNSIREYGGFDERYKIIADKDLTYTILKNGRKFVKADVVVASFLLGGTSSNLKQALKENLYFRKKHSLHCFYILKVMWYTLTQLFKRVFIQFVK